MSTAIPDLAASIAEFAIIVNPNDNVAVVKKETFPDLEVTLPEGRRVRLRATVPPGHRFATREIPAGEFVRQYGQPIGTSLGIHEGEYVSHENMTDDVPVVRDLPENLYTPPTVYYYCPSAGGYYPDVPVCPEQWVPVPRQ